MLQQFNDNEELQLEIQDIAKDLLLYSLDAFKFSLKLITNETLQEKWRRRMICTKENTKIIHFQSSSAPHFQAGKILNFEAGKIACLVWQKF
jgi:hypothetical protein